MNNAFIEQYYEQVILPQYEIQFGAISWKDHGKVGLDTWAHYFDDESGTEYVLVYEDYPNGEYLNDDLSHELVHCADKPHLVVTLSNESVIDNISGYFTLYKEKSRFK